MEETLKPIRIFYSYAHADKGMRDEIERHLGALKRSGKVVTWYDRDIQAGTSWEQEISTQLDSAQLILLLVSRHFIDSDYCYGREMMRALELHQRQKAKVIPILLSPVDWEATPMSHLQALPAGTKSSEAKPVTLWRDRQVAFLNIAKSIRKLLETPSPTQETTRVLPKIQSWPTIDTHEAVTHFHRLMEPNPLRHFRVFSLVGETKMGKSHLLKKVFPSLAQEHYHAKCVIIDVQNALYDIPAILNIACNQLGVHSFPAYLRLHQALVEVEHSGSATVFSDLSYLDTATILERDRSKRDERLTTQFILDLAKIHDQPIVFFIDSINFASHYIQMWLIEIFLTKISLLPSIRIVIAGRTLPTASEGYRDMHRAYQLQPVEEESDYIEYCRMTHPQVPEHEICAMARSSRYSPGMFLDALFGVGYKKGAQ